MTYQYWEKSDALVVITVAEVAFLWHFNRKSFFPVSSRILLGRMWKIFAVFAKSAFSVSAEMLSGPTASSLLICLMVMWISSIVCVTTSIFGGPTSFGRCVGATSILARFKSTLNCSTHRFHYSSMLYITLFSLILTVHSGSRQFPASSFVVS